MVVSKPTPTVDSSRSDPCVSNAGGPQTGGTRAAVNKCHQKKASSSSLSSLKSKNKGNTKPSKSINNKKGARIDSRRAGVDVAIVDGDDAIGCE
jgi:hypothetical protein